MERVINRVKPNNIDEMLRGYYLERKIIFEYEAQHLITVHPDAGGRAKSEEADRWYHDPVIHFKT